jgi:hypothetical protein
MLLRFVRSPDEQFSFVQYRRIRDALRGEPIVAHGFPGGGVGDVFQTEGTIGQTNIDERGIIRTDALQTSGMSGGPVLLKRDHSLIGIVVGADFDQNTGSPSSFGVLAAQEVATLFELVLRPEPPPDVIPPPDPKRERVYVPQHEALLREALIASARGVCPEIMSPLLRATCEQQMPGMGEVLRRKGNIMRTRFVGTQYSQFGPVEIYSVEFNQGDMVWGVNTTPDGKLLAMFSTSQ